MVDLRGVSPGSALFFGQALAATIAVAATWMMAGFEAALAAGFGGLVAIAPTLFFSARIAAQRRTGADAKQVLGAFYQAELGKLLLSALLFFVGAIFFGKHFAALMISCVACLSVNWLMLAVARFE
jgi:ATP synthase protein I